MVKNNYYNRKSKRKTRKTRIVISTEGSKTEPSYFILLGLYRNDIVVEPIERDSRSAPVHVLEDMKQWLSENDIESDTELAESKIEAWLVTDKDDWSSMQLQELSDWANPELKNFLC